MNTVVSNSLKINSFEALSGIKRTPKFKVSSYFILSLFICLAGLSLAAVYPQQKMHKGTTAERADDYNWLQFGFNPQHNGDNTEEKKITPGNAESLHRIFKISLPSVADGSPAYLSSVKTGSGTVNMIFVTTKDGHIIALNASNGKTIWSHQYGTGNYRINNGFRDTYTTSSPAVDPDLKFVYSYGLDGYVHKYRVDNGNEVKDGGWPELCTRKPIDEKGSSALATATDKDGNSYLYVANGGYLGDRGDYQGHVTTINLSTGKQNVFNANGSNLNEHFVERPGKPDWSAVQTAVWARPGVIYDENTNKIYFATGNGPFNPSGHNWGDSILELNPDGTGKNGFPVNSYTPTNFQELDDRDLDLGSTAPAVIPTPANCKIKDIAVQSGKDLKIRLVNLSNLSGKGGPGNVGGEIGKIIDVPSGEMVFSQPSVWVNPKDKSSWVFIGTYNGLSAFKLQIDASGMPYLQLQWKQSEGSSSPVIADNVLYCAVSGSIRALDPVTGKRLWRSNDIGRIHWESPIVDNGVLYITDESGNLTAFGL